MVIFRCLLIKKPLLLNHYYHSSPSLNNQTKPLQMKQLNLVKTSLKLSKWYSRQLRFVLNNYVLMDGPDSIINLVVYRITYIGSYPSAHESSSGLLIWLVGPTLLTCQLIGLWHACLLCMLMSWLCNDDIILCFVSTI